MNTAATVLLSTVSLAILWIFVCYFWRDFRLDAFREHIFSIRDRLFLFAAQGYVSFEEPAYKILRGRMNFMIRYAHVFTLPHLLLAGALGDISDNSEGVRFAEALGRIRSAEIRKELDKFNRIAL